MHLILKRKEFNVYTWIVRDESDNLIGWAHYFINKDDCRCVLHGPVGTHARVKELVMNYLAEEILLE